MKQQSCMAFVVILLLNCTFSGIGRAESNRPNIVWISLEDITPMMGCYGDPYARTPVFDKFAAQGIRYTHAHSVAPVCSISRSSIISGLNPTSLGTHHHRSNVGEPKTPGCSPGFKGGCVKAQRQKDERYPLWAQRAVPASHQGDHRTTDVLPLGPCRLGKLAQPRMRRRSYQLYF